MCLPLKSLGTIQLTGCGFWPSTKMVVKFSRIGHQGFQAPRSSAGALVAEKEIQCRPPKLAEVGEYEVTVSMNGEDFTTEGVRIIVYADPTLLSFAPSVLDMRQAKDPVEIILVNISQILLFSVFC